MPKLLVFLPCERVLLGATDNTVSLISLLNELLLTNLAATPQPPPPPTAQVPLRWSVFTQWQREDSDEEKTYEQRIRLLDPQGKERFANITQFEIKTPLHNMLGNFLGIPFLTPGTYQLLADWREKGADKWNLCGSFPLVVIHGSSPVTAPTT